MRALKLLIVLALGLVICLPGLAFGTVLNFDDNGLQNVPDLTAQGQPAYNINDYSTNYGGFTWTSTSDGGYWGIESSNSYKLYGNTTTAVTGAALFPSMNNVAINEDGNLGAPQVAVSNSGPINFQGAYFGAWSQNDSTNYFGASSLTINGYLGSTLVGTKTFDLAAGPLTWVDVNLNNVDKLEFLATTGPNAPGYTYGGDYFLMDNFTYTAVPLPPSVMLLGSGLMGLGLLGWRRRSS